MRPNLSKNLLLLRAEMAVQFFNTLWRNSFPFPSLASWAVHMDLTKIFVIPQQIKELSSFINETTIKPFLQESR